MRSRLILLLLLSLLLFSCASLPVQMRSIADNNAKTYLEGAPKAEEHPNAGASIIYNYNYFEFFPDGTSVNRIVQRIIIFNLEKNNVFLTVEQTHCYNIKRQGMIKNNDYI